MPRTDSARTELARLRSDLAGLCVEVGLIRVERVLARKYRTDQPREPAGQPGGGRWTSGDPAAGPASDPPADRNDPETTGSIGGGASRTQEEVATADGSRVLTIRIRSNPQAERLADWDEQHVVTAPDGTSTVIENDGPTQTVRDGDTGEVLGRNTRTSDGVVPEAFVRQVRGPGLPRQAITRAIEALATLFAVLSGRSGRGGTAIFDAPASLYRPADDDKLPPVWVGRVDQHELDAACPRNGEVQVMADEAAAEVRATGNYAGPQDFGIKVHMRIARRVDDMNDSNFIAERSYVLSNDPKVRPGQRGSLRLDLLEQSVPLTVCVYDHKTGESGLSAIRATSLAEMVQRNFPGTQRMIVIEIRPRS